MASRRRKRDPYRVNVSSIQDFMQCRFRWWAKWVMNRVPVATSPALDAGRLLHRAFDAHFAKGTPLADALKFECDEFRRLIPSAHPTAQPSAEKAVVTMENLIEAMPLWEDRFCVNAKTLAVEQPFEWQDPVVKDLTWLGTPDREILLNGCVWHMQNRGLAPSMNFPMYCRLQQRSYHEHLYAEARAGVYGRPWGGTVFNLVRKLKYRTNVGKKNEEVKTAAEMFYQQPIPINLSSGLHKGVMHAMRMHVTDMRAIVESGSVPAPNEKMNGGYGGNSEDPYFRVLIGEITLDDDEVFKEREERYAPVEE